MGASVLVAPRMDARTAESTVLSRQKSWLQRERASGRFYDRLAWVTAIFLAGMIALSVWLLSRGAEPGTGNDQTGSR